MHYKTSLIHATSLLIIIIVFSCSDRKNPTQFQNQLASAGIASGEITFCGASPDEFGTVSFASTCSEKVKSDFNLATALLHSFEYSESEKVFGRVIEQEPSCVMAYWGVAMSTFHPLWAPPAKADLEKGAKVIAIARGILDGEQSREADYIETIATIYDNHDQLDHKARVLKFEDASRRLYEKYPDDKEAAIFYALALDASADPKDKTFKNQKKAGDILNNIFAQNPNHPGIAHYIIHNYDYPELAALGLDAARKYASIAAASAHAQHMPSHIFTRLGLWQESVQSNINSISAAQCYAEKSGVKGHWDEELHGLDYLIYALLQQANDAEASKQIQYLSTIDAVSPVNFKAAYSFAAGSARYAVERKDWQAAAKLEFVPKDFPWEKFPWESGNVYFARFLGAIHTNQVTQAKDDYAKLKVAHSKLVELKDEYKANLVMIQLKACEGWLKYAEGKKAEAVALLTEAATMEEATAKHPVTPGEIIPARELLADLYLALGDMKNARKEYEADLVKHPNKFNDVYGAALASEKSGDREAAREYYQKVLELSGSSASDRPQLKAVKSNMKLSSL